MSDVDGITGTLCLADPVQMLCHKVVLFVLGCEYQPARVAV